MMRPGNTTLELPRRFWLAYFALSWVPALFMASVGALAGGPLHIDDMLLTVLLGLGFVNGCGAWWRARTIQGTRGNPCEVATGMQVLRSLPRSCALWTGLLTLVFLGGHHQLTHAGFGSVPGSELVYPLTLIAVYAMLMGTFEYFSVGALVAGARRMNAWRGLGERVPSSRLGRCLATAVVATAVVPMALVLAHRQVLASMPAHHTPDVQMFLALDLAAAALILGAAVVFFTQTVTRPIEGLSSCMARLRGGALDTRADVVTEDEIGALALGFNAMAEELEERTFLHESLGRFVPETVAVAVRKDHGVVLPREAEATILYSDIEGFTRLCQSRTPHMVFALLNEYFGALAACVRPWGGVITQFQGDAMLVTFNLPLPDSEHAFNAVRAALDIQRCVERRPFGDGVSLHTRIGISTGHVVAGTVGDDVRLGYTVHGDAVNLAQRLEEANKRTGTRVLLSPRTAELVAGRLHLCPLSPVSLPGRDGVVEVYTLFPEDISPHDRTPPATSRGFVPREVSSDVAGVFSPATAPVPANGT